jgi:hypothetical protein
MTAGYSPGHVVRSAGARAPDQLTSAGVTYTSSGWGGAPLDVRTSGGHGFLGVPPFGRACFILNDSPSVDNDDAVMQQAVEQAHGVRVLGEEAAHSSKGQWLPIPSETRS